MPNEPEIIEPVQVTPVAKPVQAEKPAAKPVETVQESTAEKAAKAREEQALTRTLSDGEWLYRVQKGDTLLSLANRYYGDYNRWRDIYMINQDRLGRGGALRPGQMLVMPKKIRR